MKHQIIEHVRKVCGLKKLEFGCEVIFSDSDENDERGTYVYYSSISGHWMLNHTTGMFSTVGHELGEHIYVIGLPVHLEHLLFALNMSGDNRYESIFLKGNKLRIVSPTIYTEASIEDGVGINNEQNATVHNDVWADFEIDLSKSVEQNLEDPQVCEVISKLLKLK